MNIVPEDIAARIYRKYPFWLDHPTWELVGNEKEFGKINLKFGDGKELAFSIYINNKMELERVIKYTLENFSDIMNELFQRMSY